MSWECEALLSQVNGPLASFQPCYTFQILPSYLLFQPVNKTDLLVKL